LVTESFLNSCFSLIFSQSNIRKDKSLFRDIIDVLSFSKSKNSQFFDVPILLKNKIECLDKICQLKLDDKTDDSVIDSLSFSEKFINVIQTLEKKRHFKRYNFFGFGKTSTFKKKIKFPSE